MSYIPESKLSNVGESIHFCCNASIVFLKITFYSIEPVKSMGEGRSEIGDSQILNIAPELKSHMSHALTFGQSESTYVVYVHCIPYSHWVFFKNTHKYPKIVTPPYVSTQ